MMEGGYAPKKGVHPPFVVDLAIKDSTHMINLAERVNTPLSLIEVGKANLEKAKELWGDNADISSVYGVERVKAGLKFANYDE